MQKIINLFLLVAMSFSIVHGVVLDRHADEHCSIQEYVAEFSMPDVHHDEHENENDACDSHYMFHISFLLPDIFSLYELRQEAFVLPLLSSKNHFLYKENTFRPPIV